MVLFYLFEFFLGMFLFYLFLEMILFYLFEFFLGMFIFACVLFVFENDLICF